MGFLALSCSTQFNKHIEALQEKHTFSLAMVLEEEGATYKACRHQFSAAPQGVSAVRGGAGSAVWFEPCHSLHPEFATW